MGRGFHGKKEPETTEGPPGSHHPKIAATGISKSGFVGHFNVPNLTSLGRGVSFIRRGTALERNFKSSGVTVDCVNDIEL